MTNYEFSRVPNRYGNRGPLPCDLCDTIGDTVKFEQDGEVLNLCEKCNSSIQPIVRKVNVLRKWYIVCAILTILILVGFGELSLNRMGNTVPVSSAMYNETTIDDPVSQFFAGMEKFYQVFPTMKGKLDSTGWFDSDTVFASFWIGYNKNTGEVLQKVTMSNSIYNFTPEGLPIENATPEHLAAHELAHQLDYWYVAKYYDIDLDQPITPAQWHSIKTRVDDIPNGESIAWAIADAIISLDPNPVNVSILEAYKRSM